MKQDGQQLFQALDSYQTLVDSSTDITKSISYTMIVRTIMQPTLSASTTAISIINASLGLRRLYQQTLNRLQAYHAPMLKAASDTAQIMTRGTREFELELRVDETQSNQNVTIALRILSPPKGATKHAHLHCFFDNVIMPLSLEIGSDNQYFASISQRDLMFKALTDINCEFYITVH